jgi:hypothetical protein
MNDYKEITSNSGLISFGNTGARLGDPRATYVKLLKALVEFRYKNKNWQPIDQEDFATLLIQKEIFEFREDTVVGTAKDVRVKTGFISQLGFTTEKRTLTEVGIELINNSDAFLTNDFDVSTESFTYLKQFLKYQHEGFQLFPLLSLIYSIIEFNNELPIDFVTYVWAGSQTKKELSENIKTYKKNADYKETVFKSVSNSSNTIIAIENIRHFFSNNNSISDDINELKKLLYAILPHGKGNSFKDKTITLFFDLYKYWFNQEVWNENKKKKFIQENLKNRYKDISSKKPSDYLDTLFGTATLTNSSDWESIILFFENTPIISAKNEESFIVNFHLLYMFIKKLSVCEEYRDLNIRHLKLLDIFILEYGNIKLDLVFWYLFKSVKAELLKVKPLSPIEYRLKLEKNQTEISEVYDFLKVDLNALSKQIASDYPEIKKLGLQNFALKQKEERLLNLVNEVFTKDNIITIFENIYPRNDKKIRELIKNWYQDYEATIPALFEYLLGISFYWLSEKQVRISSIMNSGLDANLLPKTHAAGGQADVIVRCKDRDYLIEATLSEQDGQRKMEAEPVPRHLAKHILEKNANSLGLFVAGQLDPNNLVVLRNYKFSPWYNNDGQSLDEMKILPLTISNMIYLLKNDMKFEELEYKIETLLNSETQDGFKWYTNEVNTTFLNGN